jgi:hypothetical protein
VALVILICIGGIVCLTPLALYLAWLGALNRCNRPVIVPGCWDFIALLAGLSGFLFFGGGLLLAVLQSNVRVLFRGNVEQMESIAASEWYAWASVAAAYLFALIGSVGIAVLSRSRAVSVYNLARDRAAIAIESALCDIGIPATRRGDLWSHDTGLVEIQPFDGFRHVTVWLLTNDPRRRQEIERALRGRLATEHAPDNPVAPYLAAAATTIGCAAVSFVVMIGYLVYVSYR